MTTGIRRRARSCSQAAIAGQVPGRARPFRSLRRPLRARDAHSGAGAAGARRARAPARARLPGGARRAADELGRAGPRRSPTPRGCRRAGARRCGSSARISRTPARTRSTTPSARRCSRKRLGAKRVVAETGAGQHGVASAAACARLGLPCTVYMGEVDMERQAPNVGRMRLLGATVVPVDQRRSHAARGHRRGDARLGVRSRSILTICSARRSARIPIPYLVRELQSVIGREARAQMLAAHRQACRMR